MVSCAFEDHPQGGHQRIHREATGRCRASDALVSGRQARNVEEHHRSSLNFPHADAVGIFTVFNIAGNKYRLITMIRYLWQVVYIRAILTHEEHGREKWAHVLPKTDPGKMLAHLLHERGLKPADLAAVLPKSRVSEIIAGKRAISEYQAKGLAEFFRLPMELFL
jgi:mRNA interferase HigB